MTRGPSQLRARPSASAHQRAPPPWNKRGGGEGDGGGALGDSAAAGWLGEGESGGTSAALVDRICNTCAAPLVKKIVLDSYFALRKVPPDGTPLLDAFCRSHHHHPDPFAPPTQAPMPSSKKKTSKAPKAPKSAATAPDADLFYMGDDSHTEVTRCKETVLNEDCSEQAP